MTTVEEEVAKRLPHLTMTTVSNLVATIDNLELQQAVYDKLLRLRLHALIEDLGARGIISPPAVQELLPLAQTSDERMVTLQDLIEQSRQQQVTHLVFFLRTRIVANEGHWIVTRDALYREMFMRGFTISQFHEVRDGNDFLIEEIRLAGRHEQFFRLTIKKKETP